MAELRRDPLSGRFVLLCPERNDRPRDGDGGDAACPFCPGNEAATPPAMLVVRPGNDVIPPTHDFLSTDEDTPSAHDAWSTAAGHVGGTSPDGPGGVRGDGADGPGWIVRVVPNRYPAIAEPHGAHEVVIESPEHDLHLAAMSDDHVARILAVWARRLAAFRARERHAYALLFRNHREEAGATRRHPHTQIVALPEVPHAIAAELARLRAHRARTRLCLYCAGLLAMLEDGNRVIETGSGFVSFAPEASRVPYEIAIAPLEHTGNFARLVESREGLAAMARVLRLTLCRLDRLLGDPPYNLALHDAPFVGAAEDEFHWHLEVYPRIATTGGFEWGGDCYINTVTPEDAAAELRAVKV